MERRIGIKGKCSAEDIANARAFTWQHGKIRSTGYTPSTVLDEFSSFDLCYK